RPSTLLPYTTLFRSSFCRLPGAAEKARLGGLRQGAVWRTPTCAGVSGPLHASRGHLQSPSAGAGRWSGLLPVERLSRRAEAKGRSEEHTSELQSRSD